MRKDNSSFEQNDELKEIIERYEAMKSIGKNIYLDPDQYEDVAEYYIREEKYKEAHEAIKQGMSIHPDNYELQLAEAEFFLDTDEIEPARVRINQMGINSSIDVYLLHVELLVKEGKEEEAEEAIKKLRDNDYDDETKRDIAFLSIDLGFFEEALLWLNKLEPEKQKAKSVQTAFAECYNALDKFDEAIAIYNSLLDQYPYSTNYWTALGKIYFNQGDYEKSLEATDFALVAKEENGEAHCIRGHIFFQLENYESAIESYKFAITHGALGADFGNMFIGFAYDGLGRWEDAIFHLKAVLAIAPEDSLMLPDVTMHLARCLHNLGRIEEARNYCEIVKRNYPYITDSYLLIGELFLEEGNLEEATAHFSEAVKIEPDAATWYYVGNACLKYGAYELAELALTKVKELDSNYLEIDRSLMTLYLKTRDFKKLLPYRDLLFKMFENTLHVKETVPEEDFNEFIEDIRNELDRLEEEQS
ncbi:hypothetical protein D0T50_00540 [Bacteroides sp. 214]|uniref:tetratricopeptide repeat protein n=1 Tax=Bacteroides sp. 214 TaxID=2302935 RepID=UPI0013D21AFD|nr:tetratricopeptide repeat protein [Bacteroides sp. 214]NDW11377.1 hypothetical protein [Bacteroides sp. 214]